MNLIILYGPPAVGKLSVATELSKMTGYKLLHNHLAIDFVESIFNRSDKEFWKLIDEYRLDIIKKAAKNNIQGIILTTVNIKGTDDEFIKKLIKIMDDNSGKALFVHLISDINEIKKRLKLLPENNLASSQMLKYLMNSFQKITYSSQYHL